MTAAWVGCAVVAAAVFTRTQTPDQLSRFAASPAGDAVLGLVLVVAAIVLWWGRSRRREE